MDAVPGDLFYLPKFVHNCGKKFHFAVKYVDAVHSRIG
jgi:hypothetical protein